MTSTKGTARRRGRAGETPLADVLLAEDEGLRASFEGHSDKRTLALALRSLRRWAGLTQADLAGRSGLSQSHVSKIESATGPMPSTETLHRYAAACDARVRIDFLTRRKGAKAGKGGDDGVIAAAVM
jgi:DNA-binding XRE family transcriptional regulator